MPITSSISSGRETSSEDRSIFPLSILDISRTSLISPSRCLLEVLILLRQSVSFSGFPRFAWAITDIPMMAFMGVRISWDMEERKLVLASLATRAA